MCQSNKVFFKTSARVLEPTSATQVMMLFLVSFAVPNSHFILF